MTRRRSKRKHTASSPKSGLIGQSTTKHQKTCEEKDEHITVDDNDYRSHLQHHVRDYISTLSLEMLCHIAQYLPLKDVMKLESLNKKMRETVSMHLQLISEIDFCQGQLCGRMPNFVDAVLNNFLQRCKEVTCIYGLHPQSLSKRQQRGQSLLSVPGVIAALQKCHKLEGVEISDPFLLEAVLKYLPNVEIVGRFCNRDGHFPLPSTHHIIIPRNPLISTLQLTGISLPELPRMVTVEHIHLKWVKLTNAHPFREFAVPKLRTFVMNNCLGPQNALKYVPLITGLAAAKSLSRMEFVRVPFLGGLIQHVVEDSWRMQGFRQLQKITMGACKHILEVDIGFLTITCSNRLEELAIQASLTKDSFFASLILAGVTFPCFETLQLGYEDSFPESGKWTNEELLSFGLADITENPANVTDIGMKSVGRVFSSVKSLSIYNCPHLLHPTSWFTDGNPCWHGLKVLHLRRCHAIRLYDFCAAIPMLHSLESLYMEQMFREPPKGCSRVGLSAGTGLGVSAALVSNTSGDVVNEDEQADADNDAPVADADPMEGTSKESSTPKAKDKCNDAQTDGEDEAHKVIAATDQQEQLEPGVVETDGIFYSVPECEDVDTECNEIDASVSKNAEIDGEYPNAIGTVSTKPRRENSDSSLSLTSVICSTPGAPRNGKADSANNSDKNNGNSICDGEDGIKPGTSKSASGEKVTITERKVGNQSVYVVEKEQICCKNPQGHTHSPSVVVKGTSQIREPGIVTSDKELAPLSCSSVVTNSSKESPKNGSTGDKSASAWKGKSLKGKKKGLVKSSKTSAAESSKSATQASPSAGDEASSTSKSCQAISEEIRESTQKKDANNKPCSQQKKARPAVKDSATMTCKRESSNDAKSCQSTKSIQASTSQYGFSSTGQGRGQPQSSKQAGKKRSRRHVSTKDQSTSTSDPVIEEDHVQVLYLKSLSLINLTLHQVGITSLVITACPKLRSISGTSCRVLKTVSIKRAPAITKVNFAQCKKVSPTEVVQEVAGLPGDRKRFVSLRPLSSYTMSDMERAMFMPVDYNYHMCLIHDHSPQPSLTLYNRLRASSLLDFMDDFNLKLIATGIVLETPHDRKAVTEYPWGRKINRMSGKLVDSSQWEMMTDVPWLRDLTECEKLNSVLYPDIPQRVMHDGIYDPQSRGHFSRFQATDHLIESQTVAEYVAGGGKLFNNNLIVYVNTCDLGGSPVPDMYV